MLLLTVLNHSLKVLLVCFWECSSCLIRHRSAGNGFLAGVAVPPPQFAAGHWMLCCDPHSPCLQSPLALCQLSQRCSTLEKSTANTQTVRKQRGLESGPSLYGFVLLRGFVSSLGPIMRIKQVML